MVITKSKCFIELSGVNVSNSFVIRELPLYFQKTKRHYFVKTPVWAFDDMTDEDAATNRYVTSVLGGIGIHELIQGAISDDAVKTLVLALTQLLDKVPN